ncbi:hypothetical protein [Novosphingobium jiangmenense]|jgi:hypothetical protein|uniref:Uncharacterized protein n=1 Tax=Novosphingobium jiangmenense TaxID=2791981 RepID=A0ABS0HKA5_9SPHN|nr:hypothetical protein [Novosphingobium jiangmenense]MBF9152686.1 hypothetical protein [Novosphingobium jiangmenense]
MSLPARILFVGLASIVWWGVALLILIDVLVGPCGMGPEATCASESAIPIVVPIVAAVVGYIALLFLIIRRWSR